MKYQVINQATGLQVSPELTYEEMLKEAKVRLSTPGMNQPSYYVTQDGEAAGNLEFWMTVQTM